MGTPQSGQTGELERSKMVSFIYILSEAEMSRRDSRVLLIISPGRRCWAASLGVWSTSLTRAAPAPAAARTRPPRPWPPWRCRGCGGARRCPACGAPSTAATRTPCAAAGASTASRVSRYSHHITLHCTVLGSQLQFLRCSSLSALIVLSSQVAASWRVPAYAHLQCTSCASSTW